MATKDGATAPNSTRLDPPRRPRGTTHTRRTSWGDEAYSPRSKKSPLSLSSLCRGYYWRSSDLTSPVPVSLCPRPLASLLAPHVVSSCVPETPPSLPVSLCSTLTPSLAPCTRILPDTLEVSRYRQRVEWGSIVSDPPPTMVHRHKGAGGSTPRNYPSKGTIPTREVGDRTPLHDAR